MLTSQEYIAHLDRAKIRYEKHCHISTATDVMVLYSQLVEALKVEQQLPSAVQCAAEGISFAEEIFEQFYRKDLDQCRALLRDRGLIRKHFAEALLELVKVKDVSTEETSQDLHNIAKASAEAVSFAEIAMRPMEWTDGHMYALHEDYHDEFLPALIECRRVKADFLRCTGHYKEAVQGYATGVKECKSFLTRSPSDGNMLKALPKLLCGQSLSVSGIGEGGMAKSLLAEAMHAATQYGSLHPTDPDGKIMVNMIESLLLDSEK